MYKRQHRPSPGSAFGPPEEIEALNPTGTLNLNFPHLATGTREFFFGQAGGWSPMSHSLWRVQVCRDGPCEESPADCPASGRRSPDQFHCYTLTTTADTWGNVGGECLAMTTTGSERVYLASVHSEAERALIWDAYSGAGRLWVGGSDMGTEGSFVWESGEGWTAADREAPWGQCCSGSRQPDDYMSGEDCTTLEVGMRSIPDKAGEGYMNDGSCSAGMIVGVCEREVWPTW